jgi:hypothetical protein
MGIARQRHPLYEDGQRGLGAVRSVRLTAGAHVVFLLSLNYPNQLNFKNQNGCFILLKNTQILHVGILGYYEHFSQLCRHPNLNRIRVRILDQIHHLNLC